MPRHEDAGLRDDVREAIELSLFNNVVELTFDPEDSYFWDVQPKLETALSKVGSAMLLFERDSEDETGSWSYFLYFVGPQTDPKADDPGIHKGLAIAVSLLAPFAVIAESTLEADESGVVKEPSLNTEEGLQLDPAFAPLRARLATILDKYWITVLPEEEWRKPVPWLIGNESGPVRVVDALFFEIEPGDG